MSFGFPILRLPSLARDNIINVMDPMDQIVLRQTSRKFKNMVKSLTRNDDFNISCHMGVRSYVISFGHGEKSSKIRIKIYKKPPGKLIFGVLYNGKDGTRFVCHDCVWKAFGTVSKALLDIFDPKTVTYKFPNGWFTNMMDNLFDLAAYNFAFHEAQEETSVIRVSKCRKAPQKILKKSFLMPGEQRHVVARNADWMTLDDALVDFITVNLTDVKATNQDLNRFLKTWKTSPKVELTVMTLDTFDKKELDIHEIVEGLDAIWIETAKKYIVIRDDGKMVDVVVTGNEFRLMREYARSLERLTRN